MINLYSEEYFMNSKFSNYKNYDKRSYEQLGLDIKDILNHADIRTILDFGCATGKLVKELVDIGYEAFGYDISDWAINHGKEIYPKIADRISSTEFPPISDTIICLDVLEHLSWKKLMTTLKTFQFINPKSLIIRIPVTKYLGDNYVLECSKNDETHKLKYTKGLWQQIFAGFGFFLKKTIQKKDIYDSEGVFCAVLKNMNNLTEEEKQIEYFKYRGLKDKHFLTVKQWNSFFNPTSVADFGCGTGPYLFAWEKTENFIGIGFEISKYARDNKICETEIKGCDMNKKFITDKKYNLVTAIDILEHLTYENIDQAIDNLIDISDQYILTSIPYKGNPDLEADPTHIIKENRDWWIKKFTSKKLKEVEVPKHFLFRKQLLIFEK